MRCDVRRLTDDDTEASWALGATAFGYRDRPRPDTWSAVLPARHAWGAFDESGRLVAKAVDRAQGHWFGGRIVPASGVAGVAVAPEWRGTGLARAVLARLLSSARDRGAAISTLFGSIPFPYRRMGWEEVGALSYVALPTMALAAAARSAAPAAGEVTLRPASERDVPGVYALYRTVARSGAGLLERSGPLFDQNPEDLLAAFHGVTVAVDPAGVLAGYASWDRAQGYDSGGKLTVYDLISVTPAASAAMLAMLGSWLSVAPTTVLRLAEGDPVWLMLDSAVATVQSRQPWMLRVVDLPAALAARSWPRHLDASLDVAVVDEVCAWNAGSWRLVFADGEARAEAGGRGGALLHERGLGLLYAGVGSAALLRRAGLLEGGDERGDALLDAAFAGPRPSLLDYF